MDFLKKDQELGLIMLRREAGREITGGSRRAYEAARMEWGEASLRRAKTSGLHPGYETRETIFV
jgi:hypothetical protein